MSNVSNKAEKAKVASAVADVVKITAAGVLGAEERAAKDSLSFIQKFKTDVLPLIERTATGKLNEDGPVFLSPCARYLMRSAATLRRREARTMSHSYWRQTATA